MNFVWLFSASTGDLLEKVTELTSSIDLSSVIPVRKQLSLLSTVDVVFKKLGHLLERHLPSLLHVVVCMLAQCAVILQRRDEVHPRCINGLKSLRQNCVQRLVQVDPQSSHHASNPRLTECWPHKARNLHQTTPNLLVCFVAVFQVVCGLRLQ